MKQQSKIAILLWLVISAVSVKAQNNPYVDYYNLCNEAKTLRSQKQDSLALLKYQEAFSKVPYVYTNDYLHASDRAANVGNYKAIFEYSKQVILNGIQYPQPSRYTLANFLKDKSFKKFRKTEYYKTILDSIPYWTKIGMDRKNMLFSRKIDSLSYIDQRIRKASGLKNIFNIKIKKYTYDLDEQIFAELMKLIEQYGFPSEKKVGFYSYRNAAIILLHNIRLKKNHTYFPIIQEAFDKGEYLPEDYAWLYDSIQLEKGEERRFHYHKFSIKDLSKVYSKEKVDAINKERKKIGLRLILPRQ